MELPVICLTFFRAVEPALAAAASVTFPAKNLAVPALQVCKLGQVLGHGQAGPEHVCGPALKYFIGVGIPT